MKKTLIALILALVFVLTFTLCVSAADENESTDTEGDIILGDVNGDGEVTNADVLMIFRYIYNSKYFPLPTICQHEFGNWQMTKQVTCAEDGVIIGTCIYCSKTEEVVIPRTEAHVEVVDKAVAPTCTETGLTEGKHCYICNKIIVAQRVVKANGHTNSDKLTDIPDTCSSDGTYHIECTVCKKVLEKGTLKGGHIYKDTVVAPTPTEQGYTTHTCERCGDSYTDTYLPALGFTGLAYSVNADRKSCTVTGLGEVTETEVIIPYSIDGYTVTAIGENAFENCTALTKIVIQDSVKAIGNRAFCGCTGLTEMTIPASVTSIGTQIFYKASNLSTVYYNSTYSSESNPFLNLAHIKKVVFGGTKVPSYILQNASGLKEVVILDSVTSIGWYAFSGCTSLTRIDIPISVTSIDSYAFENCTSLVSIEIPNSVTSIGDWTFSCCTSLENIIIPDSVTIIGIYAFDSCTSLESIEIPDSVTRIRDYAFYGCQSLKSVYISDIEAWLNISFSDLISNPCYNGADLYLNGELLTSVNIPDGVTSIGDAFSGCTSLTSIIIPDSVTSIGGSAFEGCTSLASITIGSSVTSIGEYAFSSCTSLTSVTIPDSVTSISLGAFSGCTSLTSIDIPDSVTSIGIGVFSGCTSLASITIPDSVTSIGDSTFNGCTSLMSINIPDSVTSIGGSAFEGCTSLASITIPDSVTSIGYYAFLNCPSLKNVYYIGTKEQWKKISIGSLNSNLTSATIHYNYVAS